jgi:hypothetical protein
MKSGMNSSLTLDGIGWEAASSKFRRMLQRQKVETKASTSQRPSIIIIIIIINQHHQARPWNQHRSNA